MDIDFCRESDPLDAICLDGWTAIPDSDPRIAGIYRELETILPSAKVKIAPDFEFEFPGGSVTVALRTVKSIELLHSVTLRSTPLSADDVFERAATLIESWCMHTPGDLKHVNGQEEEIQEPDNLDAISELKKWRSGSSRPLFLAETKQYPCPKIAFSILVIEPSSKKIPTYFMSVAVYWDLPPS